MRFATWSFRLAGIWGLVVLPPLYVLEARLGIETPPPITHPEYYYGFVGVALAWQVAFLVISTDPARYRLLMIPAILEKALYAGAVLILFAQGRAPDPILVSALTDIFWGATFVISWFRTRPAPAAG